jgi:flavodoxin
MKTLVVFYSRSGNTERLAKALAALLKADIERIEDVKRSGYLKAGYEAMRGRETAIAEQKYDPAAYDMIVLGFPIWAWAVIPPVRTWLKQNEGRIRKIALFTSAAGTISDKVAEAVASLAGVALSASVKFYDPEYKRDKQAELEGKIGAFAERIARA